MQQETASMSFLFNEVLFCNLTSVPPVGFDIQASKEGSRNKNSQGSQLSFIRQTLRWIKALPCSKSFIIFLMYFPGMHSPLSLINSPEGGSENTIFYFPTMHRELMISIF